MSNRKARATTPRELRRDAALDYAAHGIAVLPLHTVTATGRCSCGDATCSNAGKHPVTTHGHSDATTDAAAIRKWWASKAWNVGAVPGSGGFVTFDVDPWKDGERERFEQIVADHGDLPDTLVIHSGDHDGERGTHYWFRLPEGETLSKTTVGGIEIKSSGGYVVMPPSLHRTGVEYEVASGTFETISDAPPWMLNGSRESTVSVSQTRDALPIGKRTLDAIRRGLPAPQDGQTHRDVAVGIARNLIEAGTPREIALLFMEQAMLCEAATLTAGEPWSEDDVRKIVDSVIATPAPAVDRRGGKKQRPDRLVLLSLAEAFVFAQEEVDWVVPDLLAAGEKMVIGGPPKSMKTWFASHLARCVSVGGSVLDEQQWHVAEPQGVLFVQEEGSRQRWARRLTDVFEDAPRAPIYYTHRAGFSLTDGRHVDWVAEQTAKIGARLVIVDPWQRVTPGVKENDSSDTGPAWDSIHYLATQTGAAVCVLHHASKGDGPPSMDSLRGSSRMAGEVDLIVVLKKKERGTLEMFLDGRDLVRGDGDGNLEVAYDAERPHVMRTTGLHVVQKGATNRTRAAVIAVLQRATDPLSSSQVREAVAQDLGETRTRRAVDGELQVLADEGSVEKNASGKGRPTYWAWKS